MDPINNYIITLDVDWAPEEVIDYVAQQLIGNNTKATWFITHDSPSIRNLFRHPDLFEIGIHPNFMKGSTHGDSPEQVLNYFKNIYPQAVSVRTHGLHQSSNLLKLMRDKFGIENDSSLFLPYTPNIQPHVMYYHQSEPLVRLPYFWADYTECNVPDPDFSFTHAKYSVQGLKIFNFHPIHIALNTSSLNDYLLYKQANLPASSGIETLLKYSNSATQGAAYTFKQVMKAAGRSSTISELSKNWLQQNNL